MNMNKDLTITLQNLQKSGGVSRDWYINSYPDVLMVGMDPDTHYVNYGIPMHRSAHPTDRALDISCDVCIVTTLRFPGGNASSTIDEVEFLNNSGVKAILIDCPTDTTLFKEVSERYDRINDKVIKWSAVKSLKSKVIICRHPSVITSKAFSGLSTCATADHAFFVVNNSKVRPNGDPVYSLEKLRNAIKNFKSIRKVLCPISPVIRSELISGGLGDDANFSLSQGDWTPTFDLSLYKHRPKSTITSPYKVGRHGRDGAEKWIEDPKKLLQVYPDNADFSVFILGGAGNAKKILKTMPDNWKVFNFGEIEPFDYLKDLDIFAYFPNTSLSEGFGRTIVEAMIGGVPVILPRKFHVTFGDLPIYCEPHEFIQAAVRLSQNDKMRVKYLEEVQRVAIDNYSSGVIAGRLAATGVFDENPSNDRPDISLSAESLAYRRSIMV